jgi:ankyrin repeat protein
LVQCTGWGVTGRSDAAESAAVCCCGEARDLATSEASRAHIERRSSHPQLLSCSLLAIPMHLLLGQQQPLVLTSAFSFQVAHRHYTPPSLHSLAMTKVSTFMRKIFRRDSGDAAVDMYGFHGDRGLNLRLRKAVAQSRVRQVAALLDEGASPIWMEDEAHKRRFRRRHSDSCQLNALLLACRGGDVEVLSLLLDAFFDEPEVLAHFSRAMYCLVIRHDNWKAFQRLQQRRVPMISISSRSSTDSTSSPSSDSFSQLLSVVAMENSSSKLPMPLFVAAEHGRTYILNYLLDHYPHDWAHYTFEGHSLLSIATINGHYECVRVLLERQVATGRSLDASVDYARRHRQAHVLVLLTSYIQEFASEPEPVYKSITEAPPPSNNNRAKDFACQPLQWPNQVTRIRGRGSIAETVASESDEDSRRSSLLAISSPINCNNHAEGGNRVEEMRRRAELEREQRQSGMLWFLDGREPVEDMQRRVDPYGVSSDGFAVLRSARDPAHAPSSNSSYASSYQEDESWYAVKSSDKDRQHDDLLQSDEEEEESSYESMFSVHEDEAANDYHALPPVSEEKPKPPHRSSPLRPGRSRKLISVRSHGFQQHRFLAAIEENPTGETES